jgi:hypothetical protein
MTYLKNFSPFGVRGVIGLVWARKLSVAYNYQENVERYSNGVVSGQQVGKW